MVNNSVYKIPFKERLCVIGERVLNDFLKLQASQRYVSLNKAGNITVLDEALGKGMLEIPWVGCKPRQIMGKSLGELIKVCGGHVDFLKMDCEDSGILFVHAWEV